MKTKKTPKFGRWILLILILILIRRVFYSPIKIDSTSSSSEVVIKK